MDSHLLYRAWTQSLCHFSQPSKLILARYIYYMLYTQVDMRVDVWCVPAHIIMKISNTIWMKLNLHPLACSRSRCTYRSAGVRDILCYWFNPRGRLPFFTSYSISSQRSRLVRLHSTRNCLRVGNDISRQLDQWLGTPVHLIVIPVKMAETPTGNPRIEFICF